MSRAGYRGSGWPEMPVDRNPGAVGRIPPAPSADPPALRLRGLVTLGVWEACRRLPERAAFAGADLAGRLAYLAAPGTRRRVADNLAVLDGAARPGLVRSAFRSYARYWVEAFRAADLDPTDLDRRTSTEGFAHLDAVLEQGRGAIVLLAHHGSWDVAARWAETHGYHLAVVAEVLRPQAVFRRFVALREAIGLEVVPLRRGGGLVTRLGDVLAANHLVGLLTDRDLTGTAPRVTLFGAPTRIPTGAAVLARRTGAPIVPITMLQRPGRRWHLTVLPAIDPAGADVAALHAATCRALEELILLDPAQWHAFQPVFTPPSDPDGRQHR